MASWNHNGTVRKRRRADWALIHWLAMMFSAYWIASDRPLIAVIALVSCVINIICFTQEVSRL